MTITLTEPQWRKILSAAQLHEDDGAEGNSWRTEEMNSAAAALASAIASHNKPDVVRIESDGFIATYDARTGVASYSKNEPTKPK